MVNQGELHIWLAVCMHTLQIVCKNYCNFSLSLCSHLCNVTLQFLPSRKRVYYLLRESMATLGLALVDRKGNKGVPVWRPRLKGPWLFLLSPIELFCPVEVKLLSHVTLCDPMDCSLTGSSTCGIFQARVLEWGFPHSISTSRGSSQPRNRTRVSCIAGGFFTSWAIRFALNHT